MTDHEDQAGGVATLPEATQAPRTADALRAELEANGDQRARLTECAGALDTSREETQRAIGVAIADGADAAEVAKLRKTLRAIGDERDGITQALELLSDRRHELQRELADAREREADEQLGKAMARVDAHFRALETVLATAGQTIAPMVAAIRDAGDAANQAQNALRAARQEGARVRGEPPVDWNPLPAYLNRWPGRRGLRELVDVLLQPLGGER